MSKYNNVYFRIEAGYQWGQGYSEEQSKLFKEEILAIFTNDGWTVKAEKGSYGCPMVIKGKQSLYLHPMNLSGNVLDNNIDHIEEILSTAKTFKRYHTDIYNEVFDMTRDEYLTLLATQREEITKDILELFTTKRRNLYISQSCSVIDKVSAKYKLRQLDERCKNLANFYVSQVFNELIEDHKIVTANTKNGTGFRTANAKDTKVA